VHATESACMWKEYRESRMLITATNIVTVAIMHS